MRKSLFCPNPAGDTPSSARLVDAIVSGCIPVVISDELELPFEHSRHFLYSHPAQPMGPEELVWRMVCYSIYIQS
ncbi:probable arabinosyltransferase ARAD1 isoform X3 [Olea europaea var. sylvestris]|uniref:probable arabinosyltransferase ARAD1 isoform X3 n=1 Tax=Olea europaea var. sylvestris TaxID=158386 RepID=UPI000C1D38C0|nr:probable arabinosyltransferase ARAD1 isoform X3 [Olea europaea var. sylvestris]